MYIYTYTQRPHLHVHVHNIVLHYCRTVIHAYVCVYMCMECVGVLENYKDVVLAAKKFTFVINRIV